MPKKGSFEYLFASADKLLKASQSVDYRALIKHHNVAVRQLNEALNIANREVEELFPGRAGQFDSGSGSQGDYADRQSTSSTSGSGQAFAVDSQDAIMRRGEIMELISSAGFGDRIDKVYYAQSDVSTKNFKGVAHTSGLPEYEVVVAPDYTPKNGIHAVFITGNSVFSAALCYPEKDNQWVVLEKKPYEESYELLELAAEFLVKPEGLEDVY